MGNFSPDVQNVLESIEQHFTPSLVLSGLPGYVDEVAGFDLPVSHRVPVSKEGFVVVNAYNGSSMPGITAPSCKFTFNENPYAVQLMFPRAIRGVQVNGSGLRSQPKLDVVPEEMERSAYGILTVFSHLAVGAAITNTEGKPLHELQPSTARALAKTALPRALLR